MSDFLDDLVAQTRAAQSNAQSTLADGMRQVGNFATGAVKSAATAISGAARSLSSSSPSSMLSSAGNFLGGIVDAVKNGIKQAPLIPQAIAQARSLPDTLRQAQQSAQGR